jgi:hypothetical protein
MAAGTRLEVKVKEFVFGYDKFGLLVILECRDVQQAGNDRRQSQKCSVCSRFWDDVFINVLDMISWRNCS